LRSVDKVGDTTALVAEVTLGQKGWRRWE